MLSIIQFASDNFLVSENVGYAQVMVSRFGDLSLASTIRYRVAGGFALKGKDYTPVMGELTFAPGEDTQSFAVPITNDSLAEGTETFSVEIFDPANAALGNIPSAVITVQDDDGAVSEGALDVKAPEDFTVQQVDPSTTFEAPSGLKIGAAGEVFVIEKSGQIERVVNGKRQDEPFLDLTDEVYSLGISQGLTGFALDPDFTDNGYVYALYTTSSPTGIRYGRLSRFTVDQADPTQVDRSTQKILLGETPATGFPDGGDIHLVGDLKFGNDGTLLASYGDASPNVKGDPRLLNSQNLDNLGGAITRIDPKTGNGLPSNPFYTGDPTANRSRIWSYGLRNPYRFEVSDDGSSAPEDGNPGTIYIGDVQFQDNEEINISRGGENFGWPYFQGSDPYLEGNPGIEATFPVFEFDRSQSGSIIGGAIYQGARYPQEYQNQYFEADYVTGNIRTWQIDSNGNLQNHQVFATGATGITDLEYDPVTERLYFTALNERQGFRGELYAIDYNPDDPDIEQFEQILSKQVSVGRDSTVLIIEDDGSVDQWTDKSADQWSETWQNLPGELVSVSVVNQNNVWGVDIAGDIYRWDGDDYERVMPTGINATINEISVGDDGTVWALGRDDSIWIQNSYGTWNRRFGLLSEVSVVNQNSVWGSNSEGDILRWDGCRWNNIATTEIGSRVMEVDAAADGTVIALGEDYSLWSLNDFGWSQMIDTDLPELNQISVASADNIWGISTANEVYQYDGLAWNISEFE